MHRFALRLLRRSLQSIDRPAPETSQPSAAALELKMPRLARFVQPESNGSRARSLKPDASTCVLSGAALSVVPGQSGIVRSRIAACDVDGPLESLVRGSTERLRLLIYHQILAMDASTFPNRVPFRALTACASLQLCTHAQKTLFQKRVYKCKQVRYKCGCGEYTKLNRSVLCIYPS